MSNENGSTFGKRGRVPMARPSAVRHAATVQTATLAAPSAAALQGSNADLETTESGIPLSVLTASLLRGPASAEPGSDGRIAGVVPYSWRAGLLASLVVSLLQAGMVIVQSKAQIASLSGLAALTGVSPQTMVPLVIGSSILDGAQTTGFTVLIAHRLLKRLAISSHGAYAAAGAAVAAACAAAWLLLGFGAPEHGWTIEIATGVGAGFFYRLFAGASAR